MEKDYSNFLERMTSFDMIFDLDDEEDSKDDEDEKQK